MLPMRLPATDSWKLIKRPSHGFFVEDHVGKCMKEIRIYVCMYLYTYVMCVRTLVWDSLERNGSRKEEEALHKETSNKERRENRRLSRRQEKKKKGGRRHG